MFICCGNIKSQSIPPYKSGVTWQTRKSQRHETMGLTGEEKNRQVKTQSCCSCQTRCFSHTLANEKIRITICYVCCYLTKKGKQILVFLTHFWITAILIYRNKSLQIYLVEFIIKLFSHAFIFCYYNELILQTLKSGLQLQRMSHFC